MSAPTPWDCFAADLARYPPRAWLNERSVWAIAVFRLGQRILGLPTFLRLVARPVHRVMLMMVQILTNIEIGTHAEIGPGLRIHHAGPIVINNDVKIGSGCTLRVGNLLGHRTGTACPILGDRVELGEARR